MLPVAYDLAAALTDAGTVVDQYDVALTIFVAFWGVKMLFKRLKQIINK